MTVNILKAHHTELRLIVNVEQPAPAEANPQRMKLFDVEQIFSTRSNFSVTPAFEHAILAFLSPTTFTTGTLLG